MNEMKSLKYFVGLFFLLAQPLVSGAGCNLCPSGDKVTISVAEVSGIVSGGTPNHITLSMESVTGTPTVGTGVRGEQLHVSMEPGEIYILNFGGAMRDQDQGGRITLTVTFPHCNIEYYNHKRGKWVRANEWSIYETTSGNESSDPLNGDSIPPLLLQLDDGVESKNGGAQPDDGADSHIEPPGILAGGNPPPNEDGSIPPPELPVTYPGSGAFKIPLGNVRLGPNWVSAGYLKLSGPLNGNLSSPGFLEFVYPKRIEVTPKDLTNEAIVVSGFILGENPLSYMAKDQYTYTGAEPVWPADYIIKTVVAGAANLGTNVFPADFNPATGQWDLIEWGNVVPSEVVDYDGQLQVIGSFTDYPGPGDRFNLENYYTVESPLGQDIVGILDRMDSKRFVDRIAVPESLSIWISALDPTNQTVYTDVTLENFETHIPSNAIITKVKTPTIQAEILSKTPGADLTTTKHFEVEITSVADGSFISSYEFGQAPAVNIFPQGITLTQNLRGITTSKSFYATNFTGVSTLQSLYSGTITAQGDFEDGTFSQTYAMDGVERDENRVEYRDGQVVSSTREKIQTFSWGEETVQRVSDPTPGANGVAQDGGDSIEEIWKYYPDTATDGSARKIMLYTSSTGSWSHYKYSSTGRLAAVLGPYLNGTPPLILTNTWNPDIISLPTWTSATVYKDVLDPITEDTTTIVRRYAADATATHLISQSSHNRINNGVSVSNTWKGDGSDPLETETFYYGFNAGSESRFFQSPIETRYPGGRTTKYSYISGTWTPGSPDSSGFSEGPGGTDWGVIEEVLAEDRAVDKRSTRNISIYSGTHGLVLTEMRIRNGTTWPLATSTTYEYDDRGRQTTVRQDGRMISHTVYDSETQTSTTNSEGVTTVSIFNNDGELVSSTRQAGSAGNLGVGNTVTTYENTGRTSRTLVNGRLVSERTVDCLGRTVTAVDQHGRTTSYSYTLGGLGGTSVTTETLQTTNNGQAVSLVTTTSTYPDGKAASMNSVRSGHLTYSYSIEGGGLETTEVSKTGTGVLSKTSTYWDGSTFKNQVPSGSSPSTTLERQYSYHSHDGSLKMVTTTEFGGVGTLPVQLIAYPGDSGGYTDAAILGMHSFQGTSGDGNSILTEASVADRFTESEQYYELGADGWYRVTMNKVHIDSGSSSVTYSKSRLSAAGGTRSIQVLESGATVDVEAEYFPTAANSTTVTEVITTKLVTGLDPEITISNGGFTASVKASHHSGQAADTYSYDGEGRVSQITSARGGRTRLRYDRLGNLTTRTEHGGQSTRYSYYTGNHIAAGQIAKVTNPEGEVTTRSYNNLGQVFLVGGSGTYPISYSYTDEGQLAVMTTYKTPATPTKTAWAYHPFSGAVTHKIYEFVDTNLNGLVDGGEIPSSSSPTGPQVVSYEYFFDGQLKKRTWARGVTTEYEYSGQRDLIKKTYSDGLTPEVLFSDHDRLGRPKTVTEKFAAGDGVTTYQYGKWGMKEKFVYDGNHPYLKGLGIEYTQSDNLGRQTGYSILGGPTPESGFDSVSYTYTSGGQLQTVATLDGSSTTSHNYTRHPNSTHIHQINSSTPGLASHHVSRNVDLQDRLTGIRTRHGGPGNNLFITSVGYEFDRAGRRTVLKREDATQWRYQYNDRGELVKGEKHLNTGARLAGQQYHYSYDDLGNRESASYGGDDGGNNLRTINYTSNGKNQYTGINHPRYYNILAQDDPAKTLSLTTAGTQDPGVPPVKQGSRTRFEAQKTGSDWEEITNNVSNGTVADDVSGKLWLPPSSQTLGYDSDGNLLNDEKWDYVWDGENRLVSMTRVQNVGTYQRLDFVYDWMSRRIRKEVTNGSPISDPDILRSYLYDGWNLVAEMQPFWIAGSPRPIMQYTWGPDASGTFQGAGGVGGLLKAKVSQDDEFLDDTGGEAPKHFYPSFDGNGNIIAWTKIEATVPAENIQKLDYDPFGNVVTEAGSFDERRISFGFSTKYQDVETGLLYYGYRYYDPVTGRWPSRDPFGEKGGMNLYGMIGNDAVNQVDRLGLSLCVTTDAGVNLFFLDDKKNGLTTKTVKEIYKDGIQWFEPHANNYMKLVSVVKDIKARPELKHFTWVEVAQFSIVDRWSISYRSGGSGDWKKVEAKGFVLVEVDGDPYWADAIGQIPFAVNTYYDYRKEDGRVSVDITIGRVLKAALNHAEGNIIPSSKPVAKGHYDEFMVIRGAIWASKYYSFKKFRTKSGREYDSLMGGDAFASELSQSVSAGDATKYGIKK